ncbi:hypothetical protein BGZ76_009860 [Entomortierella beljakovae]|nr:hypothetical protein BGZ76_009860 [Entomortierella beljakovae]
MSYPSNSAGDSSIPHAYPVVEQSEPDPDPDFNSIYPSFPQENILYPPIQNTLVSASAPLHSSVSFEEQNDAPPSYEAVAKDTVQIHDNYDHLRGPPSQRGRELKDRIPSESLSASYYNRTGESSGGVGTSSSNANYRYDPNYGSTSAGHGSTSSPSQGPPNFGLQGPIALNNDEEGDFAQDMDRLLGEETDNSSVEEESDMSSWAVAGDGRAWAALGYFIIFFLPWTLFCFAWTLTFALVSSILLIIPPLGYLFTIFSVTSWRALARADLVLSSCFVSHEVLARYPYIAAEIFIAPEPGPAWTPPRFFGHELPLPEFIRQRLQRRHTSRGRRPRNLWHRGANHLKATWDHHTVSSMFYFIFWKMMFAIPAFVVVVAFFSVSFPFMICCLPSVLVMSRSFANMQYRWAVNWLSEKPTPIVIQT